MTEPPTPEPTDCWQELAEITNTLNGDGGAPAGRHALESAACHMIGVRAPAAPIAVCA